MVRSLAERFRRAVLSDDLASAKAIAQRAMTETCNDAQPFDICNQTILRSGQAHHQSAYYYSPSSSSTTTTTTTTTTSSTSNSSGSVTNVTPIHIICHTNILPALSASQHQQARQSRGREKNRQSGHCKSSLALAIESGASIELIQWLLDMGHERNRHTQDFQNCTMVALAALHNRADVIEALCIDTVAGAASLHHEKSLTFGSKYRKGNRDEHEDEGEEEDDVKKEDGAASRVVVLDQESTSFPRDANDSNNRSVKSAAIGEGSDWTSTAEKDLPTIPLIEYNCNSNDEGMSEMDATRASSHSEEEEEEEVVNKKVMHLLNMPDELGRTPLALTSMKGYQEVVTHLLGLGADIDLPDYEGNTPIHYAASYNHLVIVQILIERGCSFALKNSFGFTAADYAYTSTLKGALEAFARAKFEKDRKGIPDAEQKNLTNLPSHKLKSSILSSAKAMQASLQLRLNH